MLGVPGQGVDHVVLRTPDWQGPGLPCCTEPKSRVRALRACTIPSVRHLAMLPNQCVVGTLDTIALRVALLQVPEPMA